MAIVSVVPLCVKLIDFGMAKRVEDLGLSSHSPNRGTFLFMPAEAKDYDWRMVSLQYGASVDVFALGATLLACAFGADFEEIGNVDHLSPRLVNDLLSGINASWPDATGILAQMLSEDPIERPSCDAILEDPWVRKGISENDENEALRKALEESKEENAALQEALDDSRRVADKFLFLLVSLVLVFLVLAIGYSNVGL